MYIYNTFLSPTKIPKDMYLHNFTMFYSNQTLGVHASEIGEDIL